MTKKTLQICFMLFFICNVSKSQSQYLDWAISFGENTNERGRDIKVDNAGNVITVGSFSNTVDFNSDTSTFNLTASGSSDAYVHKVDSAGEFVWAKRMGGSGTDLANAIAVDDSLNIYTVGFYYATIDLDPDTGVRNFVSNGSSDIFIQKLNADGDLVWAHSIGGALNDAANDIQVTANGVYIVGPFRDSVDFDPGPGVQVKTGNGFYVLKLNLDGNFQWVHTFTGGTTAGNATAVAANDSVLYVGGTYIGTVDFDPDPLDTVTKIGGASTSSDAYILKLKSDGDFVWVNTSGAPGSGNIAFVYGLEVDDKDRVYASGSFSGTIDFDSDTSVLNKTAYDDYDAFVQKISKDGELEWINTFGGTGFDYANDLVVGSNGNVYSTGAVTSEVDFDPGVGLFSIAADEDFFIHKVDSLGQLKWVKLGVNTESNDDSFGLGIDIDSTNNIYTVGEFNGSVDFDPAASDTFLLSSNGNYDVFIQKTNSCGVSYGTSKIENCEPYTWINGVTYFKSDSAEFALATATCDTLRYTLNLTIHFPSIDSTISINGDTLFSNELDSSLFQWLDCNNNFAVIDSADSSIYVPKASGSYAVEIIDTNGCVDTSECIQIIIVGLGKNDLIPFNSNLYPSPTKGSFSIKIESTSSENISIAIYNLSGKLLFQKENWVDIGRNNIEMNELELPKGVYIVAVNNGEYQVSHKLVVF